MNHPIKYRAWADGKMREVRAISFTETGEVHRIMDSDGVQRWPIVLLQFTGLKDKNGKEIYEGDVVRVHGDAFDKDDEPEFEVKWHKQSGYFMEDDMGGDYIPCLGDDNYELEVIGNIYENAELITKK
jgi:uncharacterized phage protein (TIGR01671 family)